MSQNPESSMSTYNGDVDLNAGHPIFKVLRVDLCAREILRHLPLKDLVRSESVCRAWQYAVHYHLENYWSLKCICVDSQPLVSTTSIIKYKHDYVLCLYKNNPNSVKVVKKLRSCIKQVIIIADHYPEQILRTIAKECFSMWHVEIKGLILNNIGYFFSLLELEKFKSLKIDLIKNCDWNGHCLLSAITNLKNITSLEIHNYPNQLLNDKSTLHSLLNGMPKLEILKLHRSAIRRYEDIELSSEFIKSISGLCELKSLDVTANAGVNDMLLEALALGCRKLEHLNISGCRLGCIGKSRLTARGVAALCRRSPSAATTLDFTHYYHGYIGYGGGYWVDDSNDYELEIRVQRNIKIEDIRFNNSLCEELEALCCVNLRQQHLEFTHLGPDRKMLKIEVRSGCNAVEAQDPRQELKIILGGLLMQGVSRLLN